MKFEMTDASGSYDWMLENLDPDDAPKMLDSEMHDWIDNQISIAREQLVTQIHAAAELTSYPVFGYTTAQVLENEDAYIQFTTEDMDETLVSERENMFQHFKTWQKEKQDVS